LPYIFTVSVFSFLICAKLFTDDSNTAITITIFDNDFIIIYIFGKGVLANPFPLNFTAANQAFLELIKCPFWAI
jgi:hypothetical protein